MSITYVSPEEQKRKHCKEMDLLQLNANSVWQMMIFCMMLNRTKRAQVDKVRGPLFELFPSSSKMAGAWVGRVEAMIKSLGFGHRRARAIIDFSKDYYLASYQRFGYELLIELEHMRGIGDYALDSYAIFQLGHINIRPKDKELIKYVEWLGADTKPRAEVRFVILAGHVISKYDQQMHWVSARNLLRLYNLDPQECILLESDKAWNRWIKSNDTSKFTILGPLYHGNYKEVHDKLMQNDKAVKVNWKRWEELRDKPKRK